MGESDSKDVQIHIYEHVAPIRERISHLEGRVDSHDREFKIVRETLEDMRERLSSIKDEVLDAIDAKHDEMLLVFRAHEKIDHEKDDAIMRRVEDMLVAVTSVKAWVAAAVVTLSGAYALWQFVSRLHHGG